MKPEGRIYIKGHDGHPFGPVRWTSVREWVATGYFGPDDKVRKVGEGVWSPIRMNSELVAFSGSDDVDDAVNSTRVRARERKPVGPRAAAYLARLGCPVELPRLNPFSAFYWVRFLEGLHPELVNQTEHWAAEEESNGRTPAATPEDATAGQIETLRARGLLPAGPLTRLQAQRLISGPPTEEQIERLKFWGLALPGGACQEEAAEIISRQIRENWDAEVAFQAHQRTGQQDRAGKPRAPLKLREKPKLEIADPILPGVDQAAKERRSPAPVTPPSRNRTSAVVAGLLIALVAGALAWWMANRRGADDRTTTAVSAETRKSPAASPDPAGAASRVTVLKSSNQEAAERLRTSVLALKLTSLVTVAGEPSALIDGRLFRVGDVLPGSERIVLAEVDSQRRAVAFTDERGNIVQRGIE